MPDAIKDPAGAVRRCVCPGSFDPVTLGHLDVVLRAAEVFDVVHVGVAVNPAKQGLFSGPERVALVRDALEGAGGERAARVEVEEFGEGLLVDHCRRLGARVVVKGLRGGTDYAYELPMALMNRHLADVETLFLVGDPRFEHVSSSLVKEVARHGGDVSDLVPPAVHAALLRRLRGQVGEDDPRPPRGAAGGPSGGR
ncbi:pantetheine-phosphate adenylyltransferase [Paenibacillus sp. TRM 82003]|uniref:pantetheine-phosphate adenylyltransferase n=1 Tax=Kineococcus sp. TRM81007 TaxID=2925831 RepID=UPI001F597B5B|nr:pantetheine-phosphate adenylyltransferase [Kineococcus sp. TRM81007]MCI2240209.1 pantetheine-phosphate adenylyltransferase [Kineococcus sp. TRM81007]MCI3927613.1 pantetheine-phosphate adenylyltransferase [Paenibacillus sp. TRM 82003]